VARQIVLPRFDFSGLRKKSRGTDNPVCAPMVGAPDEAHAAARVKLKTDPNGLFPQPLPGRFLQKTRQRVAMQAESYGTSTEKSSESCTAVETHSGAGHGERVINMKQRKNAEY
jgi:hypothetical protein